jgi:signal transduction histidine kinase
VAAQAVVALVVGRALLAAGGDVGNPLLVLTMTGGFALAGGFTLRLEFRRHQVELTLGDALLVVAFFVLGPVGVAASAAAGELTALAWARVPVDKVAFNVTNRLAAATVASAVFFVAAGGDDGAVALFAALGAVLCFSLLDVVSTSTVMAVVEGARLRDQLLDAGPTALLTSLAAAPLGIAAVALAETSLVAPVLLVPLVGAVALNARDGARQRDEHLRFERLYQSSVRTARLLEMDVALAAIANEARTLATGAAAMCVTTSPTSGASVGVVVDDDGARPLADAAMRALLGVAAGLDAGERPLSEVAALAPFADPAITTVTLASGPPDAGGRFAVAVLRDARSEPADDSRVQTLSAFATHGALIAANAWLFAERDEALRHQIDLNRQKSDFVATVSHELRTPLAAMIGSVDTMLRLDGRLPEHDRGVLLKMALEQGGRLQRLIEDLLLVAAAEHTRVRVERGRVDVAALLEDLRGDTVEVTSGRVTVSLAGHAVVVTDQAKLLRILRNLVENAAKYAPDGPIEVAAEMRGSELVVAVRDHGPGIAAEHRQRVFERFVQLDQTSTRRQGGTGLGLYLSRQLAHLLGGHVDLESPEDGGCRFVVRVPSFDDGRSPRTVAASPGRGRVLRRPVAPAVT